MSQVVVVAYMYIIYMYILAVLHWVLCGKMFVSASVPVFPYLSLPINSSI